VRHLQRVDKSGSIASTRGAAIRGAIAVSDNSTDAIRSATRELLSEIVTRNNLVLGDIYAALFSMTKDLNAAFPGLFAREMGWGHVAMLHFVEVDVPRSMERCLRVLVQINSTHLQPDMRHVYLGGAAALRPDLAEGSDAFRHA